MPSGHGGCVCGCVMRQNDCTGEMVSATPNDCVGEMASAILESSSLSPQVSVQKELSLKKNPVKLIYAFKSSSLNCVKWIWEATFRNGLRANSCTVLRTKQAVIYTLCLITACLNHGWLKQ